MKEISVGLELVRLRKGAKINQADLASKMGVDQSSISRWEKGDVEPSADDVQKYLAALGSDPTAKEFAKHWASKWFYVFKPHFHHPHRSILWKAEIALVKLEVFAGNPATPPDLVSQALMYKDGLIKTAAYLLDVKHNFGFVGNIMVGKTTALCAITGLLIQNGRDLSLKHRSALETGAGWITVSENHICWMESEREEGGKFGLVVYPHSTDEIFQFASDICESLFAMRDGKETESRVPEEIERALRSMAELNRKPAKGPDGVIEDPLFALATSHDTSAKLTAEFVSRMKLQERTTTDVWFNAPTFQEGLIWLQSEFKRLNNGRNPKVSLPKRLDVFVPIKPLKDSAYHCKFIDSKGVDGSPIRPDLQSYLDDDRTITVLCSRFAPDITMQELIGHLAATGKHAAITERIIFLVLTRRDEAVAISNEDGTPIEKIEDAYALREAQIRSKLARFPGGKDIPILFFDAALESPNSVLSQLKQKLDALRAGQVTRLEQIASATDDLVSTYQQQQALDGFAKLRAKLQEFLALYRELPAKTIAVHDPLITATRNNHARTVWACTRRHGEWTNLNAYLWVGTGANIDANKRSDPAMGALGILLDGLLGDSDCAAIHSHILVLKSDVAAWRLKFLDEVSRRSQEIFRAALHPDDALWNTCKGYWLQGDGFRSRVVNEVQGWLKHKDHEWIQEAVEGIIRKDWQDFFIGRIQALCKASDFVNGKDTTGSTERRG